MNRIIKIIFLNLFIAAAAVLTYSEGLLGLRVSDPSIFKAGLSVLIGMGLAALLIFGNLKLLRAPKLLTNADLDDMNQVEAVLKQYNSSAYFGHLSRTAGSQYKRFTASAQRTLSAIHGKFQPGSMSAEKYTAVVNTAKETAEDNIKSIALRLQMLSDSEYRRLRSANDDDIPREIKEKQLDLYERNTQFIKKSIAVNENLILKLDTLALEVSDSSDRNENDADELADEITRLTNELRYYK